ncbi:ribosomal RNA large subunit methyltransferase J [Coprinopsis sp. MPI-PUGE-AT-0042]|nr:ribosomal RNA large subunit methyltransferase J [Coprinopsis sp. MPI-PUGE-AT-0042]
MPTKGKPIFSRRRDPYVKQRQVDLATFRSRSAFKLVEINEKWDNFLAKPDVNVVVDLGAAPGGWSQVVDQKLGWGSTSKTTPAAVSEDRFDPLAFDDADLVSIPVQGRGTILAVDLLQMQQIHGVHDLVADFLAPTTDSIIQDILRRQGVQDRKVDVILFDMAANVSGNDTRDIECSLQICEAVLDFAKRHLRTLQAVGRKRAGAVLVKHFSHLELDRFRDQELTPRFGMLKYSKPSSSRAESREGYFLCMGWRGDCQ